MKNNGIYKVKKMHQLAELSGEDCIWKGIERIDMISFNSSIKCFMILQ